MGFAERLLLANSLVNTALASRYYLSKPPEVEN